MQLDAGLLTNAWSAAGYFAQMLGRACRVTNPHKILTPLMEEFLSKVLFEREVDLYSGEVDHRMRDADVMEHIRATFTPLILSKTVQKKERQRISQGARLSTWKPYQASSTEKRPAVQATRTMFNLVPCENEFEREFADFCDYAGDVGAFAKNAGPQKLMIDYLRPDGHRALYVPDFFIRLSNGGYLLVELKGKVDNLVPVKARAAVEWCKASSTGKTKWRYLYVPYFLFQQSAPATMDELARACEPSLKALIEEAKTGQMQLPLLEATAKKEEDERFAKVLQMAGMAEAPAEIEETLRQAVHLLDYAIRAGLPEYNHAFQPMLRHLDDYAIKILDKRLRPRIPGDTAKSRDYFAPYIDNLHPKDKGLLGKNQRYLKENLVFGRPIQRLGTLLFCLDYAQTWALDVGGVWRDAKEVFSGPEMKSLYAELKEVNEFRNTRVAHVETKLDDAEEAWGAMVRWFRCLNQMSNLKNQ